MRKIICDRCGSEIKTESDVTLLTFKFDELTTRLDKVMELCSRCTNELLKRATDYEHGA